MFLRKLIVFAVLFSTSLLCGYAAEIAGKWTAEFDTSIGVQKYIFEFTTEGARLTGTTVDNVGGTDYKGVIKDGQINGDEVTFVENLDYQGMPLEITYKGKISGDEIKFTRNVSGTDEGFVAKRVK